jgi:NADH:ubiquinone reductase (H+-translocating)
MLATIGRSRAIAQVGRIKLSGRAAWLLWCFAHIYFLIGFRNRLLVMVNWAWSFATFQRGARLITGIVGAQTRDEASLRSRSIPSGSTRKTGCSAP